jgi:hypothetical protein
MLALSLETTRKREATKTDDEDYKLRTDPKSSDTEDSRHVLQFHKKSCEHEEPSQLQCFPLLNSAGEQQNMRRAASKIA